MIPQDLKMFLHSPQTTCKISDEEFHSLEARTTQFTTNFLQSADPVTTLNMQIPPYSLIKRSEESIHFDAKQKLTIEELPIDIESHYYQQLLQAKRKNLIQEQIFYLEKLSDHYLQKQKWAQASKLLNCALAILEKNFDNPPFQAYLLTRLERIEVLFLESKGFKTPNQHEGTILNYRNWLKNIRTFCTQQQKENVPIQEITRLLTNSYKKLLGTLILDSQELIGNPATQWACIGMGSMARDEMCPYSDLEFAFLIHSKTEKTLDFFRTLSQLLELRIINFGETKFPIFAQLVGEKSIVASPTPGGFSMDSGGNTPLGKPGFYELIDTPQGLANYQCIPWMEADIIVTNALSTTCHVAGDERLFHSYTKAKQEALDKKDGLFSLMGIPFRNKLALKLLEGNLQEYKPNLSKEKQEINAFGIKKELYRPLQSLLSSLSLFYGLELRSTFIMIQQLLHKKILSPKGAANLTKTLDLIIHLRFKAHNFYQNEEELLLHIEQESSQEPCFLYLDEKCLKILHDIYMVVIPLQSCAEKFLVSQEIQLFAKATLYDESPLILGAFFTKTRQFAKAQEAFQNAVSLNPNDIEAQLHLGDIEDTMGKSKEALPRNLKALSLAQQKYGENHLTVAKSYNNAALIYNNLGEYSKALEFYQKALKINLQLLDNNHPTIAISYNNIGTGYDSHGERDKALEFFQKALKIQLQELGENHPNVSTSYNNIGTVYCDLGEYDKAIEFLQKALKIQLQLLGENNPSIATIYKNTGLAYKSIGQLEKALEFYQKALIIQLQVLGENHPKVATIYKDIGLVYKNLGEWEKTLEFYQKALKIQLEEHGENHASIAANYNSIGLVHDNLEEWDKALECYQKALKIQLQVLGENHLNVATSYNNIGLAYNNLGEWDKALEFSQTALKIRLHTLGKKHQDVGRSYTVISTVYHNLEDWEKVLEFSEKALKIQLQVLSENHPEVATSYNNIGTVYDNLEEYDKALDFFQKALIIWLKVYGKNHPHIEIVMKSIILYRDKASSPKVDVLREISILCTQILGAEDPLTQQLAQLVK